MKTYNKPDVELIYFGEDIVTTSVEFENSKDNNGKDIEGWFN